MARFLIAEGEKPQIAVKMTEKFAAFGQREVKCSLQPFFSFQGKEYLLCFRVLS